MKFQLRAVGTALLFILFFLSLPARAWDRHQSLMPFILDIDLRGEASAALKKDFPAPCPEYDERKYQELSSILRLNPEATLPVTSFEGCGSGRQLSPMQVLAGPFVDDPDRGMDQNLSDEFDPHGFRTTMGGKEGPTSQGFRHMYFGGWSLDQPFTSFQVPFTAIGEAPDRAFKVATHAKEMVQQGETLWGARVLSWGMHYIQDLGQPYHSTQIPHLQMVPWTALFHWPPTEAFTNLVKESTRTISNYHWAYEKYVHFVMQSEGAEPFNHCLKNPAKHATFQLSPGIGPEELARTVHKASVELAGDLGAASLDFFGTQLKKPEYDLAREKGALDYAELLNSPEHSGARKKLHHVTCKALANTVLASRSLLAWGFNLKASSPDSFH